jgi:hypothetical protein
MQVIEADRYERDQTFTFYSGDVPIATYDHVIVVEPGSTDPPGAWQGGSSRRESSTKQGKGAQAYAEAA